MMLLLSISVSQVSIPHKFVNIEPVYKVSNRTLSKSNFILYTKITTSAIQGAMSDDKRLTLLRRYRFANASGSILKSLTKQVGMQ